MKTNLQKNLLLSLSLLLLFCLQSNAQWQVPEYVQNIDSDLPTIYAGDLGGGYQQVLDLAARDAVPTYKRALGMMVTYYDGADFVTARYDGADTTVANWTNAANWAIYSPSYWGQSANILTPTSLTDSISLVSTDFLMGRRGAITGGAFQQFSSGSNIPAVLIENSTITLDNPFGADIITMNGNNGNITVSGVIKAENGGGQLDLRTGGINNNIAITTDNGAYGEGWLYMTPTVAQMGVGVTDGFGIDISTSYSKLAINTPTLITPFFMANVTDVGIADVTSFGTDGSSLKIFSISGGSLTTYARLDNIGVSINTGATTFNAGIDGSTAISTTGGTIKTDNTLYTSQIGYIATGDAFEGLFVRPALTADRAWTLQDSDGTFAWLTDIPAGAGLWSQTGNYIYPTTLTDSVGIGTTTPNNSFQVKNLISFISDSCSTFLGDSCGTATTGLGNVFIGHNNGYYNVAGRQNVFMGCQAGYSNVSGNNNVFIGEQAGYSNTTANSNTFVGRLAGTTNSTGFANTFIGKECGRYNSTGSNNTGFGTNTLKTNDTGSGNTVFGNNALVNATNPDSNVVFGYSAMGTAGTCKKNVAMGFEAGNLANNVEGCVLLGFKAGYDNTTSNRLMIDNSNTNTPLIDGNFTTKFLTINGNANVTGNATIGDSLIIKTHIADLTPTKFLTMDGDTTKEVEGVDAENFTGNLGNAITGADTIYAENIIATAIVSDSIGLNVTNPNAVFHAFDTDGQVVGIFERESATTGSSLRTAEFHRTTSGTASAGIGSEIAFRCEDNGGNLETTATIKGVLTDVSASAEEGKIEFEVVSNSALESVLSIYPDSIVSEVDLIIDSRIVQAGKVTEGGCLNVADDGTILLIDATTQSGVIWVDGDDEWSIFSVQDDGTVSLPATVGDVVNTDTDTNLCIFDSGTGATIRNRLGSAKTVCYEIKYKQ